jgi:hypothetical protein
MAAADSMEKFMKEQEELDKSHRIAENLRAETKSGNGIFTIMVVIIVASVCGLGIAFTKSGKMSITITEEPTEVKVEKIAEFGVKRKNIGGMTVLNDEIFEVGENCGEAVAVGEGCHITKCESRGEIGCYNVNMTLTLDEMGEFRNMACFCNRENIICNVYNGVSMLYFTVEECGIICDVLSDIVTVV